MNLIGSAMQWTPDTNPQPIEAVIVKFLPSDECVAVIRLVVTGEVTVSRIGDLWLAETATCALDCDGTECDGR